MTDSGHGNKCFEPETGRQPPAETRMTIDQPDPPQMTAVNRQLIYWEDVEVGPLMEYGSITVTRDAIIDFARRFDPQTYHVDEAAARAHRFGGLVASGLHTSSMCMRL